jgi:hypothetical protein
VPFAYYARLSARDKAVYRQSDAVVSIRLSDPAPLVPLAAALAGALGRDQRAAVEVAASDLARALNAALGAAPVDLTVHAVRPTLANAELHGLYTREPGRRPRIQLWMRTAHHKRVVAFRTFLRTLLHELGHHFDYELLKLSDSFHTEGFFKRESSLFKQLVP